MKALLLVVFFFLFSFVRAQNLVINPGAEVNPTIMGWTLVSCHWINGAERPAHGGSYHFYAGGADANPCELYQDIDVSAFATSIDGGFSTFDFSAWMRSYSGSFGVYNDRGRVVVEYRNAASTVLSTYDTGMQGSTSWVQYSDSRVAPAGTRTIRIRLLSDATINSDSDGYFDDISLIHTTTLPVSLLSFGSYVAGSSIVLNWQTAAEVSNDFFTLEKSLDGMEWNLIATLEGKINSSQLSQYQMLDEEPVQGIQYYRLSQTDVDGTVTTFTVIAQNYSKEGEGLLIFPNPSTGAINVHVTGKGQKTLRVVSFSGQEVRPVQVFFSNDCFLDLSELAIGSYVIEVYSTELVLRKVFVKE